MELSGAELDGGTEMKWVSEKKSQERERKKQEKTGEMVEAVKVKEWVIPNKRVWWQMVWIITFIQKNKRLQETWKATAIQHDTWIYLERIVPRSRWIERKRERACHSHTIKRDTITEGKPCPRKAIEEIGARRRPHQPVRHKRESHSTSTYCVIPSDEQKSSDTIIPARAFKWKASMRRTKFWLLTSAARQRAVDDIATEDGHTHTNRWTKRTSTTYRICELLNL